MGTDTVDLYMACKNKWVVMHGPLWGQALWQDLWEIGHQKQITVYRGTGCGPLASPGSDEAATLAKVWGLETVPTSPSEREIAQWLLHPCLLHDGQKTMWPTIKTWALILTLAEVQEAFETCVVCS